MAEFAPNQLGLMEEASGACASAQPSHFHDEQVLVLAPKGSEAKSLCAVFSEHHVSSVNCSGVEELCRGVECGAGAAVVAGELLAQLLSSCLTQVLSQQLPWSDFPLIVLAGRDVTFEANWKMLRALERFANVTLLERPVSAITLLSTVRTALRSRRRQYELRELTGRKQAEENLLKEKNFSDVAINSLPGIFYVVDAEGHILRWNKAFEEVTGYSAVEIARMHPLDFVPEEFRPTITEKLQEVFTLGQATVETELLTKRGVRVPYFLTGNRCLVEKEPYLIGMGIDISSQKEAARKLEESYALAEQRVAELDAVIESMPDAVYIGNESGITKCNTNALRQLGVGTLEEFNARIAELGSKFAIRWPDGRPLRTEELQFARALRGETSIDEVVAKKLDTGEDIYLRAASAPIWQNGRILGAVAINSDITERKRAEQSLARLAAIVEFSEDAIIGKDLAGIITSWNGAAERIFGYLREEAVGHSIAMLMSPDRLDEEAKILERLRHGEPVEHYETVRITKDGRKINVSLTISPIRDAAGNVVGISKIARDITRNKQAEEALCLTRERLDMVAQSTELGFWYCDLPFDRLNWDAKAKEHFGLPPDAEVTIDTFYQRLHPDDREGTRQAIDQAIAHGARYDVDYRTVGLDGRVRWVRAIGHPYYDDAGKPIRFDGITLDITDRKQVEKSLEEAKEEIGLHASQLEKSVAERTATLEASLQSISGVLYHVAHDLRAPLRAMQGFTTILEEEYAAKLGETGADYARRIAKAASRMDKLIHDLLAYGRLAHVPLNLASLDLNQQMEGVIHKLANEIHSRHASIRLDDGLPKIWADPDLLDLILFNLLENALTFVAPGDSPKIEIHAAAMASGTVRITIQDHGLGVAPEHQERIFRVFERLDHGNVESGTGIGLAIVRKAAERMGGAAGVESKPGIGSHFWFKLPAARKK